MLFFLTITAALYQTIPANGFLNNCPINRDQRIGDALVKDILQTFYKDLVFVQACTESRQKRQYYGVYGQIKVMAATTPDSEYAYAFLANLLQLIIDDQIHEANSVIFANKNKPFIHSWIATYFYYFEAEVKRLIGRNEEAVAALLRSFLNRQESRGISMNRLEKLDGLLILQKVSLFNEKVNKLYGLKASFNYQFFDMLHFVLKHELAPLKMIRAAVVDKFGSEAPVSGVGSLRSNNSITELPEKVGINALHSVDKALVESILCEFAQKFNVIGDSLDEDGSAPDYSRVIDQLRRLDARLAQEFEDEVVKNIETDKKQARKAVSYMWRDYNRSPHNRSITKGIFLAYFHIELSFLQSKMGCNTDHLDSLQLIFEFYLKGMRKEHKGLSLDMLVELNAKIILHFLKCFHERVKLAYELDGSENEQQLEAKHSQLGESCERTLPESILLNWNHPIDD